MTRRMTIILSVALPVIALLGYVDTHFYALADSWDHWKYERWMNNYGDGVNKGQQSAARDMEAGRTNYCVIGLIGPGMMHDGLPLVSLGCVGYPRLKGFADGYNLQVTAVRKRDPKKQASLGVGSGVE